MSMTELERVTNQRDYNRRLADHQQTVIDRLNAEITAMQDDAREKRVALIAAQEMADALDTLHDAEFSGQLRRALAAFRAATGAA